MRTALQTQLNRSIWAVLNHISKTGENRKYRWMVSLWEICIKIKNNPDLFDNAPKATTENLKTWIPISQPGIFIASAALKGKLTEQTDGFLPQSPLTKTLLMLNLFVFGLWGWKAGEEDWWGAVCCEMTCGDRLAPSLTTVTFGVIHKEKRWVTTLLTTGRQHFLLSPWNKWVTCKDLAVPAS